MPTQKPKLPHSITLIIVLVIIPACTCWGIPLEQYFPLLVSDTTTNSGLPPGMNCSLARLTSPRGGLPDGQVTFYWDALAGAVSYQINVYSGGVRLATFAAPSPATNLTADVGFNAIGGENPFEVELIAYDVNGYTCTDKVVQDREWHVNNPPPPENPPIVSTPTCEENPYAEYCK